MISAVSSVMSVYLRTIPRKESTFSRCSFEKVVIMPNLSQIKRQRMLDFLETLKKEHTDDEFIRAFTEIENQLRDRKYGLVWEEHSHRNGSFTDKEYIMEG